MRARVLLAWAFALTLLLLVHPAWARSDSVVVLGVRTQASMSDAVATFYATPVDQGKVVVMVFGASGVLIKNHEKVALIDPAGSISGDAVKVLQQLDILLITHEHSDHFSYSAVVSIQSKTGAIVVANPGAYSSLSGGLPADKVIKMRSGDVRLVSGITITAVAAVHESIEPLTYILTFSDFSAFHGSDSGFNPKLSDYKGKAKLAIVPTGGASPTASPSNALSMIKALDPSDAIPMHGTKDQDDKLGVLITQQTPNVQYLRPSSMASVVVSELSAAGFVTVLASAMGFFLVLRVERRKCEKQRQALA